MSRIFVAVVLVSLLFAGAGADALVAQERRLDRDQAILIGGSTAAGAAIGGMIGGSKGALAGAIVGGAGSAIYDKARNDEEYGEERTSRDKLILIGGSAGTGAAAGAIAGGKKGALIGAGIGAAAGYILHRRTDPNR